jgi:hypothetical protein
MIVKNAIKHGYDPDTIFYSTRKDKKYMIRHPVYDTMVHFGQKGMEDYTVHRNEIRRLNYLRRSDSIQGNWRLDDYSPNNLARRLLWNATD